MSSSTATANTEWFRVADLDELPEGRITPLQIAPPPDALATVMEHLRKAKRPVIIVGHGARFHREAITAFAEQLNAPVLTTFKASLPP